MLVLIDICRLRVSYDTNSPQGQATRLFGYAWHHKGSAYTDGVLLFVGLVPFADRPELNQGYFSCLARRCAGPALRGIYMLDLLRTPADSVWVTTLLRKESYSNQEFGVKRFMTRILYHPHFLCPILKATRHHGWFCGVLCHRPSFEIGYF